MEHDIAKAHFNDPVDVEGLGIPDYLDIIKASLGREHTAAFGCLPLPRGLPEPTGWLLGVSSAIRGRQGSHRPFVEAL